MLHTAVLRLCGVVLSLLATGPKGRGFKPSRGDKKPQHTFLQMKSKAGGPNGIKFDRILKNIAWHDCYAMPGKFNNISRHLTSLLDDCGVTRELW
jgi:hypothetical protein